MIKRDGRRRCLIDNAMPTLHLSFPSIAADCATSSSAGNSTVGSQGLENIEGNSHFVPAIRGKMQATAEIEVPRKTATKMCDLRMQLRRCRALLRKKATISKQRRKLREHRRTKKNKWEELTSQFGGVQQTIMEMIAQNFERLPQVSRFYILFDNIVTLQYMNDKYIRLILKTICFCQYKTKSCPRLIKQY